MPPCNPIEQTAAFWNINPFVINRDPEVPEELFELARLFPGDMTELHSRLGFQAIFLPYMSRSALLVGVIFL